VFALSPAGFTLTAICPVPVVCPPEAPPTVAVSQLPPELVEVVMAKGSFTVGVVATVTFWAGGAPPVAVNVSTPSLSVGPLSTTAGQASAPLPGHTAVIALVPPVPLMPSVVVTPPIEYVASLAVTGELMMAALKGKGIGAGMVPGGNAKVAVKVPEGKAQERTSVSLPLTGVVTVTVAPGALQLRGTPEKVTLRLL